MKLICFNFICAVAAVAVEEHAVVLRLALENVFAKATVIFYFDLAVRYGGFGLFCSVK